MTDKNKVLADRLKLSLIDRDWEDIERDLLPPGRRLENLKTTSKGKIKIKQPLYDR